MNKLHENTSNNNQNSQSNPHVEPELSWNTILTSAIAPLVPVLMAKLTGQKLPVANPVANEQGAIQQLTPMLQSMINTQNLLLQEIIVLKKNYQTIVSNLQNFRLTHEKKQIDFNSNSENHE